MLPPQAPRKGNRCTRWIGERVLSALGWRIEGTLPDRPKLIIAAAPHTSNWDFILAMLAVLSLGLKASYLMKKEAFFWPFAGLFKWLGGVPVERHQAGGMVGSLTRWFSERDKAWLLITPEGTRKKVGRYKTGFLRVAESVDVPVMLVSWDYPTKRIVLEKIWTLTGDNEADCEAMRQYLTNRYQGRQPDWQ
ncbi:MAG TPA: 1-acyl-sn-glycerol-3-phosphate acyltransferase [Marinagarivorans sp.]